MTRPTFLQTSGRVAALRRTTGGVTASVTIPSGRGCGGCAHPCLGGLLAAERPSVAVDLPDATEPALGSWLELTVAKRDFSVACAWVFGVPLLGVAVGAGLGDAVGTGAALAPLGGAAAICCVLGSRRWLQRRLNLTVTAAPPPRQTVAP